MIAAMLTEDAIAAAAPRAKGYKLADSAGLHVFVSPKGSKSFRMKYRFGGVEKRLTFGLFPTVSLAEARRLTSAARLWLKAKRDPADAGPAIDGVTIDRLGAAALAHASDRRVYFVRAGSGLVKIGVAQDVAARVATLQRDCPDPLSIIGSMPGSYSIEQALHRLFAEDRHHGEWFAPSQRLLDFIDEHIDRRGA